MSEAGGEFEWSVDAEFLTLTREKIRNAVLKMKEKRLSRRLDTSDLVQDSMLEVARSINTFRGTTEAEFDGWLKAISANTSMNASRHHHARKRDVSKEVAGLDGMLSHSSTPDAETQHAETLERLAKALGQIDEREQEVVMQHLFEKLRFEEIAKDKNCSISTIQRTFNAALASIKRVMQLEND